MIHIGNVLDVLPTLPEQSVHCCVSSPPYWALRDYQVGGVDWPGTSYRPMPGLPEIVVSAWHGQLGIEPNPEMFVAHILEVYREVWRVLRDDGTCWINLGDTFAGSWGAQSRGQESNEAKSTLSGNQIKAAPFKSITGPKSSGLRAKDQVGIPHRVLFALQADGWYKRDEIIWHKKNPMPSSQVDRCTNAHEFVLMLTKQPRYEYDQEAIKEPSVDDESINGRRPRKSRKDHETKFAPTESFSGDRSGFLKGKANDAGRTYPTRIKRSVWTIASESYKGAHFATFPQALVRPMILAGSPDQVCSECGKGYKRIVESERVATRPGTDTKVCKHETTDAAAGPGRIDANRVGNRDPQRHTTTTKTVGFSTQCECCCACDGKAGNECVGHPNAPHSTKSVVLDPFFGSGTTGKVAERLGRDWIGIEVNPEYVALAEQRTAEQCLF